MACCQNIGDSVTKGHCLRFNVNNRSDIFSHKYGYNILHLAVNSGSSECLIFLLELPGGCEYINEKGDNDMNPLHLAIRTKQRECLKVLLEYGADVDSKGNASKETPLHAAVYKGDVEYVKLLMEHGADITATDIRGETAYHVATTLAWCKPYDGIKNYFESYNETLKNNK